MPTRGQILIWCAVMLMGVAVVMINSASMSVANGPMTMGDVVLGRPAIYMAVSVAVLLVIGRVPIGRVYRWRGWTNPAPWLLIGAMALCALALVPGVGAEINGSKRWLAIGSGDHMITFQPSELAKWSFVFALAWWSARHAGALGRFRRGLLPALVVLAAVCGLIVVEDLGTAVLIGAVGGLLLIAGGARLRHVLMLVPPAVGLLVVAIITQPYRMKRLLIFLDPWADPQGAGYQPIAMMAGISTGGRGLGNGIVKQGYLPADTTDAIFAIICEEMGFAGAVLVIGVYLVMLWTAVGVLKDCRWVFGRLLVLGVVAMVGMQAVMNIAVVTVVVPTKGIALPLLSSGGTGWVLTCAALGLIVAVDRLNRVERAERSAASATKETHGARRSRAHDLVGARYPAVS